MDETRARELLAAERERVERVMSDVKAEDDPSRESEGDQVSELSSADQHPADLGTETFEREKDLSILESLENELAQIEAALRRVDEGTYGTCEACGQAIAPERLEAQPAARFCIDHAA
ncbi:MAG TPA: TraR/DksA C4-type zinc finger protein [Acidimicrobiia bacterium]|nr:TraR/DksA C4-type zinc finger protein [Acidimicrobiia bacterium]